MKICICTTPIRPNPDSFPPLGSLAIIQALREFGEEVFFYNIDYHRPNKEKVREYFRCQHFDVVGISAVVSTAYAYTKALAELIREENPNATIVVGGNLAASAELLLRKCNVHYCVVGDGEQIICRLISLLREKSFDVKALKDLKGIAYLDDAGAFRFTGYAVAPPRDQISWPDYRILEEDGSIEHYISDNIEHEFYGMIPSDKICGRKFAFVICSKGCVARCTFCHRWEKGYRAKPVDQIRDHILYLRDHYGVGFLSVGDENFGSNAQLTEDIVKELGALGMRWRVAGVRARTVTPEKLRSWKENGCVAVFFGIESGSQKMLDVMEKNTSVKMNSDAIKWVHDAGLFTIIQLVIGMPGEDDETIQETTDFLCDLLPYLDLRGKSPGSVVSINYAQSLPGTPLYESAREEGVIGPTEQDEEEYLLKISDTNAAQTDHFVNYTEQPLLKVLGWRFWMISQLDAHHLQRTYGLSLSVWQVAWACFRRCCAHVDQWASQKSNKIERVSSFLFGARLQDNPIGRKLQGDDDYAKSGYFNIRTGGFAVLFLNSTFRRLAYPLSRIAVAMREADSFGGFLTLLWEHVIWSLRIRAPSRFGRECSRKQVSKSLRKTVNVQSSEEDPKLALRLGR